MYVKEALSRIEMNQLPELSDYSVLQLIKEDEFYYEPPITEVSRDENSKFILFSAPGAVGKTALARYIAKNYNGFYWNVAKSRLNDTAFAGVVSHAVGIGKGAVQDSLYASMKNGKCLFVLDSFDEACLISGRDGVKSFLCEIGNILQDSTSLTPTIILTARTDMAQFILESCRENDFGVTHYSVDYFNEKDALDFVEQFFSFNNHPLTQSWKSQVERYLEEIKSRLGQDSNRIRSFIGYAQVLTILCKQIEKYYYFDETPPESLALSVPVERDNNLIYNIIQELINREQKKLEHFRDGIRAKYIERGIVDVVDNLYNKQEQLVRLQYFLCLESADPNMIALDDYAPSTALLPEDQEEYLTLLRDWLPLHVFLQAKTIMPVFLDYLLAESLIDPKELGLFVTHFQENNVLPSRVFADCYLELNHWRVNSEHIYYLTAAFFSLAGAKSKEVQCEISTKDTDKLFLTFCNDELEQRPIEIEKESKDSPLVLNRAENLFIDVPGAVVLESGIFADVVVRDTYLECDELYFNANSVVFESYSDEHTDVIAHNLVNRKPGVKITIHGTKRLKVNFPNCTSPTSGQETGNDPKRLFFEFNQYWHAFEDEPENEVPETAFQRFAYGLQCVLEEFRGDRYGNPAKFKARIDKVCRGPLKSSVLGFLIDRGVIEETRLLYILRNEESLHISRNAVLNRDENQLKYAFDQYSIWMKKQ